MLKSYYHHGEGQPLVEKAGRAQQVEHGDKEGEAVHLDWKRKLELVKFHQIGFVGNAISY